MKQGVLQQRRVRLLLSKGHSCYRPRRTGERVRKSVRGCIVGNDIAVLALSVVKQGDADIPGLTDNVLPKRLGPKRATKVSIRDRSRDSAARSIEHGWPHCDKRCASECASHADDPPAHTSRCSYRLVRRTAADQCIPFVDPQILQPDQGR